MESDRKKKQRHPLAQTVRGDGHPSFTARLVGVETDLADGHLVVTTVEAEGSPDVVLSALRGFVSAGAAAQAGVDELLAACACGHPLASHDPSPHRSCRQSGCACCSFTGEVR